VLHYLFVTLSEVPQKRVAADYNKKEKKRTEGEPDNYHLDLKMGKRRMRSQKKCNGQKTYFQSAETEKSRIIKEVSTKNRESISLKGR